MTARLGCGVMMTREVTGLLQALVTFPEKRD